MSGEPFSELNPPPDDYADVAEAQGSRAQRAPPRPNGEHHDQQHAAGDNGARKLKGIDFAEMQPHLTDGYVIKGLMGRNSLVGIIGPTGSGKTFFAADLAIHIAARRAWRAHKVAGGLVVYAALEGPVSAEERFVACRIGSGFIGGLPLRLTPGPVNLRDPSDVLALIEFIRQAEQDHGEKCVAVFVDTVSRAMAGGDENSSEDMSALVAGADAIRLTTGATVVLVHHLGKDETRGARGHSSFKAALDTEIEVTARGDDRVATVTKQRDLPSGKQLAFRLTAVELGHDDDGDPVTSCILEASHVPSVPKAVKGSNQKSLLAALQEWKRQHPNQDIVTSEEMLAIGKSQGMAKNRCYEARDGLVEREVLKPCVGGHRFVPDQGAGRSAGPNPKPL